MLTYNDVKFIFDSARSGLFSSANILQIADVALRVVVFLLLVPYFSYYFPYFLLLKRVKCPPFCFHNQNTLTSSLGLLG